MATLLMWKLRSRDEEFFAPCDPVNPWSSFRAECRHLLHGASPDASLVLPAGPDPSSGSYSCSCAPIITLATLCRFPHWADNPVRTKQAGRARERGRESKKLGCISRIGKTSKQVSSGGRQGSAYSTFGSAGYVCKCVGLGPWSCLLPLRGLRLVSAPLGASISPLYDTGLMLAPLGAFTVTTSRRNELPVEGSIQAGWLCCGRMLSEMPQRSQEGLYLPWGQATKLPGQLLRGRDCSKGVAPRDAPLPPASGPSGSDPLVPWSQMGGGGAVHGGSPPQLHLRTPRCPWSPGTQAACHQVVGRVWAGQKGRTGVFPHIRPPTLPA